MLRKISVVLAVMLGVLTASAAAAQGKPNIVFIMADDLGYESVRTYGGESYATPNMDALAAGGVKFTNAYATPLCTNTRIQLMTGKYQQRVWQAFGVMPKGERVIGQYMKQAGYGTIMVGKWQLTSYDDIGFPGAENRRNIGMHPSMAGFDEWSLFHTGHTEDKGSRYADPTIETHAGFLSDTKGKYGPDLYVNHLLDYIDRKAGGDTPFFAYYAMALPHGPFNPTPDSPEWADPAKRKLTETRFYGDMVEYGDKLLGKVLAKLEEKGIADNTLVIFYSDNGTHSSIMSQADGRWLQGGKGYTNQLGIRVPLMARWTGKTPVGAVSEALVDTTDFLPTILAAAGASNVVKEPIDGHSFLPQILGAKGSAREWSYLHHETRPGGDKDRYHLIRMAQDGRYKLFEDGRMFRIDYGADIYEEHPLMPEDDDQPMRAARRSLQAVLDGMKPYKLFDPAEMPRPNPALDLFARNAFVETFGRVVMEAETVPFLADESWHEENFVPGFSGRGYVRSLRDQPDAPTKGILRFPFQTVGEGKWLMSIRHRFDHADPEAKGSVWVRLNGGKWRAYETTAGAPHSGWRWPLAGEAGLMEAPFDLARGDYVLEVAPRSDNLKLDKIILYREDRDGEMVKKELPESEYTPWIQIEAVPDQAPIL